MTEATDKYYFRDFINPGKGTAFIEVRSGFYPAGGWDGSSYSCSVKLADCNDSIELEFYCNSEERRDKRLHKVNMLLEQLNKVKQDLEKYEFIPADPSLKEKADKEEQDLMKELGIN